LVSYQEFSGKRYVPYFLKLFVDAALLQLDAATLRGMRPKRRVLLVRFLAKALLCPDYRCVSCWSAALFGHKSSPKKN
jgi:hypothetical protein